MTRPFAAVLIGSICSIAALATSTHSLFAADASDAPLSPLKVQGSLLIADGKAIRVRGLDWGWWHLMGTRYSEADMQNVAKWGANAIRLSFSYNDLETDETPTTWREQGFHDIDDVLQWAKRYGVYVILDMHVVPGGQSDAPYCAGGHNLLWTDKISQERFVALWEEIARRYRDRPEVAAYELLNEPGSHQKTQTSLHDIDQRAIDAIRTVAPDKIIIVGGDSGSGPGDLTDAMKFADTNILYTIHWYIGAGGNEDWVSDVRLEPGIVGDGGAPVTDWIHLEKTATAPPGADHMSLFLRSTNNSGSAWFDDVEIKEEGGNALQSASFDTGPQGYRPEALPETMSFDPTIGRDKAGSLKVHASTEFNDWPGWVSQRLRVRPGVQYQLSAWVKLDHATGNTFLGAGFFRSDTQLDRDHFEKAIQPAVAFAKKFDVPIYVGEFGCDASNPDLQPRWVSACISLFETNGLNWTYWNDKETASPSGMGLQAEHSDGSDWPVNDRLLSALRAGWKMNQR